MNNIGTPILWTSLFIFFSIIVFFDLLLNFKTSKSKISFNFSIFWSIFLFFLFSIFSCLLWFFLNNKFDVFIANNKILNLITGYLIEKFLSIDNLFVWLVIFRHFNIHSLCLQSKLLTYGVLGAIFFRLIVILSGFIILERYDWFFYIFGIFIFYTGIKIFFENENSNQLIKKSIFLNFLKKRLRITNKLKNDHFFITKKGLRFITPFFVSLIMIEFSDVIFALDSIPAVFSITSDSFIIISSNLFAMLGMRSIYLLLSFILIKNKYLKYGIGIILIFISIKILLKNYLFISNFHSFIFVLLILLITLFLNIFLSSLYKIIKCLF
ncbi:TerC/Alx family metal homeostasis membrane protein [Buchnera aphidicola (Neophyllaphis varicolor)]|uniref:TerC/Alx family metal homeostasis membrane protein n=1 Tax=Buchnera aphidicola TaxID=9 RepID=UPI0031B80BC7